MRPWLLSLCLLVPVAGAAGPSDRWVGDTLVIVMRSGSSSSSPVVASLQTGTRMELLESGADGYARVRLENGSEGWVQERYLAREAPAGVRIRDTEKRLEQAESELKSVRAEHEKLLGQFQRLSEGRPPPPPEAVARELDELRARVRTLDQRNQELERAQGAAADQRQILLLGGALVAAGFVLAWLVRLMWPRKRWGDL